VASLLDIASSGIQAYRKALSVTGQNIANIDTEGYRRREVNMREVSSGQNDITTISDQTGLGVQVSDIGRAFDVFLAARSRSATSDFAEADASRVSLEALESTILPDDYDINFFLKEFFDGLNSITQSPADLSGRVVAISQGTALAGAFSRTSSALSDLKDQIFAQAEITVGEMNSLLTGLRNTQRQVVASAAGSGANSILDSRDQTLADLSQYVGLTVDTLSNGAARVRLGASGNGPILGTATEAGSVALQRTDDRLIVLAGQNGNIAETQEVTSGRLAGLIAAYDTVSLTLDKLDALAKQLAQDFNAVHAQGLSLDGKPGGMMFSADSWAIARAPTNLGDFSTSITAAQITPTDAQPVTFTYDAAKSGWIGTKSDGSVLQTPKSKITLDGVTVNISGQPANGDSFTLAPSIGKAANLRFLLTRPEELAAASMIMASANASNLGSATLGVVGSNPITPADLPLLSDVTGNDLSSLAGARLRENGVVGIVPAGTLRADLASLTRQEQISFTLSSAQTTAAASLTVTLADGAFAGTHTFAWPDNSALAGDAKTIERIAQALNTGALKAGALSLADLGLHAAGSGTNLTLAAETASFSAGSLGDASGLVTPRISAASDLQIFTREGVQIAGTALSQADVIRYLTAANGFLPDAEYRADYLNTSYRGMTVDRVSPTGGATLTISGAGFAPFQQAGSSLPLRSSETGSLTLTLEGEASTIALPQGAMAGYIASLVQGQSADTGLAARASTRVALSDIQDGTISFQITGANTTPITINSGVSNGSLSELATAINAQSAFTGFTALLGADGTRLVLSSDLGDDLALAEVTASGGAFKIGAVDDNGALYATALTLGGVNGNTAVRVGGTVALTSASSFSVSFNGATAVQSQTDAFTQGLMSRTRDPAGGWQEVGFNLTEGLDGNESSADGLSAAVGATTLSLNLGGLSVSVKASTLPDLKSATVAQAMANALRGLGSVPTMTGVALSGLPANGSTIGVTLGRETYQLEMVDNEVRVLGPEANRITAYFDSAKRLQISATGGSISGEALALSADTPTSMATAFGLTSAASRQITGQVFSKPSGNSSFALELAYGGSVTNVTVLYDKSTDSFTATGLPTGVTLNALAEGASSARIQLVAAGNDQTTLGFLASAGAVNLGLVTAGAQVTLTGDSLRFDSVDGNPIALSGASSAQNGSRLRLSGVPNEDLIVLVTGTGARMIASALSPATTQQEQAAPNLSFRVMDATSGRVEIFDQSTGSAMATRYLGEDGTFSVAGHTFRLNGALISGDQFNVTANLKGTGDATNITALMGLQARNAQTGEGGFRERFGAIVTEVGAKTRATKTSASEAQARQDAAVQQDAEFSGVNLDTEAAKLLEQQQAYQALARVLRTSTELLQSLLDAIS
jgi:flagellar hook-associated protein 1 FlgK